MFTGVLGKAEGRTVVVYGKQKNPQAQKGM